MDITEIYINSRYNTGIFYNHPKKQSNVKIIYKQRFNDNEPFFSIVMPIHNQENIIEKNLNAILENTTDKYYEMILILDSCSDNTKTIVLSWVKNISAVMYPLVSNILILNSTIPLFETAADNLGFFCSKGKYCLEIQADMEMTDKGYNMQLLKPFTINDNIIGISGRCCLDFKEKGIGKLNLAILKSLDELPHIDKNAYYTAPACNRGPLMLDRAKLIELNYLDEVNYFLDYSDMDLFARAVLTKKWICAYVPIDFNAPLENGSTRKKRNALNQKYYNINKKATKNGINGFFNKNKHILFNEANFDVKINYYA